MTDTPPAAPPAPPAPADVPRVVSSRFDVLDAHTMAGYESSGSFPGYQVIRTVLETLRRRAE